LADSNQALADTFEEAKHAAEAISKFMHESRRYPFTAVGDVNTYALFSEHARSLLSLKGQVGIIVPTGIATEDTTKQFLRDLVSKRAIKSIFDFENRKKLFPAVDSRMKFCLLTLSSSPVEHSEFIFFATQPEDLRDSQRRFSLEPEEIAMLNPNTLTIPLFRSQTDARLTLSIMQRIPVLMNERTAENAWGAFYMRLVDLGDHSEYLRFPWENKDANWNTPLYESKLLWAYDHRFSTFSGLDDQAFVNGKPRYTLDDEKQKPNFTITPRYLVNDDLVIELFAKYPQHICDYLLVWRDVARATDERTCISTIIPKFAASRTCPGIGLRFCNRSYLVLANLNSMVFDYITRQKVGGIHFNWTILTQLPVLPPDSYTSADAAFIAPRVLELVYTAYDLKPFAEDMGYTGEPFRWDEERRALLRAELDAYYARLYGLTRDELRYILDPQDVYGLDFPGETFRVLKEKEIRHFGEYRTRRLVLEAWDRLEGVEPAVIEKPVLSEQPAPVKEVYAPPAKEKPARLVKEKTVQETSGQPTFSDFGLYKCGACGKMVMGFDRENHAREAHKGKNVEWVKVK